MKRGAMLGSVETERLTLDASNAFKILGISRNTGYGLIQRGEFPLPVIKAGKRLLIPKIAVERLLGTEGMPND